MSDRLLTSAGHLALALALIPLAAVTVAGQSSGGDASEVAGSDEAVDRAADRRWPAGPAVNRLAISLKSRRPARF